MPPLAPGILIKSEELFLAVGFTTEEPRRLLPILRVEAAFWSGVILRLLALIVDLSVGDWLRLLRRRADYNGDDLREFRVVFGKLGWITGGSCAYRCSIETTFYFAGTTLLFPFSYQMNKVPSIAFYSYRSSFWAWMELIYFCTMSNYICLKAMRLNSSAFRRRSYLPVIYCALSSLKLARSLLWP